MLARMWGKENLCTLLVELCADSVTMENGMEDSQQNENRTTIWSSNSTSETISKRNENSNSKRYLPAYVHGSIIYNSQEMETTSVSINGWMDKEVVVYTHERMLFSH